MQVNHISERGMTLIEVLVALVIVALALAAAIRSVDTGVLNTSHLKQRSIAQWVAMNHANELQLQLRTITTDEKYATKMAGQTWQVQSKAKPTADKHILRIEVRVKKDRNAESSLASLITYVAKN